MLGWLECRSMARTRRSGVNRSCVLIAPISSTGAPGELGTRPRARSRRSTQRLVEWSDVFSAEASCCAAVPVGGCERGRGERAHAAHLVHAHAANLLKLLCDRRCLGRGASRLKAVEDAVVLARHSSCVPARSHPRGRRHDGHGFQDQNAKEKGKMEPMRATQRLLRRSGIPISKALGVFPQPGKPRQQPHGNSNTILAQPGASAGWKKKEKR